MPITLDGTAGITNDATDLNYTGTLTGGTGVINIGSGQLYKDASGNVLIGSTSLFQSDILQLGSTSSNSLGTYRFSNNAFGPNLNLGKSRGGTVGTNTIVQNGDRLGDILFYGANGTTYSLAAAIQGSVDGTPGASNDMPGRLQFLTTPDGSGTPVERMRIASDGAQSSVIPGGSVLLPEFKCRAWVNFDGTTSPGTIRASGNVSSVTRNGTGDYTVNFTTAMPDANYAVSGAHNANYGSSQAAAFNLFTDGSFAEAAPSTSSFRFVFGGLNSAVYNPKYCAVSVFR